MPLPSKGEVVRDKEFRWSLKASRYTAPRESETEEAVPSIDTFKRPEVSSPALERSEDYAPSWLPLSKQVGHWIFTLRRTQKSDRERWTFRCVLCGLVTTHLVRPGGYVLPLTGKLRTRRRRHDLQRHPEALPAQREAESELLGKYRNR